MATFKVELWLDGYDTEEEMTKACEEFIYDQLNFSGSGVSIELIEEPVDVKSSIYDVPTEEYQANLKKGGKHLGKKYPNDFNPNGEPYGDF